MTLLTSRVFVLEKEGSALPSVVVICVRPESLGVLRMGGLCRHISAAVIRERRWGRAAGSGQIRLPGSPVQSLGGSPWPLQWPGPMACSPSMHPTVQSPPAAVLVPRVPMGCLGEVHTSVLSICPAQSRFARSGRVALSKIKVVFGAGS